VVRESPCVFMSTVAALDSWTVQPEVCVIIMIRGFFGVTRVVRGLF
jgi:hypothetical protein